MNPSEQNDHGLTLLRPYVDSIAGGSDAQRIDFVASTWRRWLGAAAWEPNAIAKVLDCFPDDSVTRSQLRDLACKATDDVGRRDLLVAALIWGRGKSNGRMRDHIVGALTNAELDDVLMSTAVMATTNGPADAYRAWRIAGLREPFFTKWLWAASCIGTPERRCLVLDARVWSTLNEALSWSSLVAAGTRRRAARYEAYVDTCHSWAAALGNGVSAEDVEWALFAANGDLARLGPSVDQAIEG